MSIFQELFTLFLSALGGSGSFHIGKVNIGITTAGGSPEVLLSLGTQPSSVVTTTTVTAPPVSAH